MRLSLNLRENLPVEKSTIYNWSVTLNSRGLRDHYQYKIISLSFPEREKSVEARADSKGIRLDVYAEDKGAKHSFDLEMQVTNNDNLGKRIRYYQGLIDSDKLKHGQHYRELGESFIIFICPFKVFRDNHYAYTMHLKTNITMGDGATKIFLSTKDTADAVEMALLDREFQW